MSLELSGASASTLVEFDGITDPTLPLNWPFRKKVVTTVVYGLAACWATLAIGIYSAGMTQIADEFGASAGIVGSGLSMTLFGQALGSLLWAPLCEIYGRKWVVLAVRLILQESLGTDINLVLQSSHTSSLQLSHSAQRLLWISRRFLSHVSSPVSSDVPRPLLLAVY